MQHRIVVVDDDPIGAKILRFVLDEEGYSTVSVGRGSLAFAEIVGRETDLVILDVGLPDIDGFSLCKELRARHYNGPVIFLTSRTDISSKVTGFQIGADDYIVKPYDVDELLARMRALIRRSAGRAEPVFEHEGVTIDPQSHAAMVDGAPVALTAREWAVLEPLIARPGMIFSRAQLEEKLYSWKDSISSNAVEVYIHGLRKKLGSNLIQNVRGVGYVIPKT